MGVLPKQGVEEGRGVKCSIFMLDGKKAVSDRPQIKNV